MSDFNSSLPTRTENNGDVVVKVVDGTLTTQTLSIDSNGKVTSKLNDGAGNAVTSQTNGAQRALDVGINVLGVQVDPRSIRALTSVDVVTANQGSANTVANGWPVKPTDGTNSQSYTAAGEAKVTITEPLPAGTNAIGTVNASNLPTTVDTNFGAVGASTIRTAAEIGNASGAADFNAGATSAQTLRTASNLYLSGTSVSATNPVPVTISAAVPGTAIQDYNIGTSVASAATSNHDYTVSAGKTLQLARIWASASGKLKIEVQYETAAASNTFVSKFVGFNSTASPNIDISIISVFPQVTGARIRIIRTNLDKQSEDVYSTIEGTEQ